MDRAHIRVVRYLLSMFETFVYPKINLVPPIRDSHASCARRFVFGLPS